jgi:UDP-N-acetylglucosamine--N-acetylmuramyl-(pentapeptide) pyrophosphoryl-undecaprenol N-acetylglucosamine transferase
VPVAILAPDVVLGLSNRWLLPFAGRAYVAFRETEQKLGPRALRTGVPLRGRFQPSAYVARPGSLRILVMGGSQGARALNEVIPFALVGVARQVRGVSILHQAGRDRDEEVRRIYRELGASGTAEVVPFIDDVATELARADLFIGRAGAGALAELCAIGRASILIPLPAKGVHQRENAEALAASGAAVAIAQEEATAERIAGEVVALAEDEGRRFRMAEAARVEGRPDAARTIARDLLALAGIPARVANGALSGGSATASGSASAFTFTSTSTSTSTFTSPSPSPSTRFGADNV